jgi:hypothetical protein
VYPKARLTFESYFSLQKSKSNELDLPTIMYS